MNRKNFMTMIGAAAVVPSLARAKAVKKPNVIFIFTDDQRYDTISALGNPHIITPNLDRLAKRSMVFRNAYNFGGNAAAVCVPARNMAMTGNTFFRFDAGKHDKGLGPTFPKSMKAAGYETYNREKSGSANLPYIRPQFDHYEDVNMVEVLATGYAARGIVDDAIDFVSKERDTSRPFFMYLGFPCPHDPRWAAQEFRDMYDPAKLPLPPNYKPQHHYNMGMMTVRDECLDVWPRTEESVRKHIHDYYSLITGMDADIGRLLDTLDQQGLTENTIVIFSADQGLALGSHGLLGKQSLYEDVQRVPFIISGPGIKPGESDAFAYVHDIFPTVCDLTDAGVPQGIDGKSLKPVINGTKSAVRDSVMLAYCSSQRSVRDKQWKLIQLTQINRTMLFDLKNDPRETKDLSANPEYAEVLERMTNLLKAEQQKLGDTLPLTTEKPRSAEFIAPKERRWTPYPDGGLAPGEGKAHTMKNPKPKKKKKSK